MWSDHPKGKIDRKSFRKMLTEAFLHSKNPVEDVEKVNNISLSEICYIKFLGIIKLNNNNNKTQLFCVYTLALTLLTDILIT